MNFQSSWIRNKLFDESTIMKTKGNRIWYFIAVGALSACSNLSSRAEVKLPAIFGDNMVLQQGMSVPVWGHASPGEQVSVTVYGETRSTTASDEGKWKIFLPPLVATNEPTTVTVSGTNTITLTNVLVGEVWLGSGQSNMGWPLGNHQAREAGKLEAEVANYPKIRLFTTAKVVAAKPQENVEGKWVECTPETAKSFSATLYFMGRELHQKLNMPMGLIHSSWGGTIIQCWSRYDSLVTDSEAKQAAEKWLSEREDPEWCERQYQAALRAYEKKKSELQSHPAELKALRAPEKPSPLQNYRPGGIYNSKIAPLTGYGIRGIAWYQGEFNNGHGALYSRLLPKMITDWRNQWGQGDFPFIVVQLPSFGELQEKAEAPGRQWAHIREAQLTALTLPNTAVVTTIDLGAGELHPRDKEPFGIRVATAALKIGYGKHLPISGPLYRSMEIEGDSIRLSFDELNGGFVEKPNQSLAGFTIAGADQKFFWATARIEGDSVLVKSNAVKQPLAVRYAWADNPQMSLFNKAGFPASPFRTDNWPIGNK